MGLYNLMHMSLITRCTACGTMFKVVPDQLKMGDGWVRCGQCAEVFDASASLQEPAAPLPGTALAPAKREDAAVMADTVAPRPLPSAPPEAEIADVLPAPVASEKPQAGAPNLAEQPLDVGVATPEVPDTAEVEQAPSPLLLHTATHDDLNTMDAGVMPLMDVDAPEPADTPTPEVSFVRQAERKAFWRRPLVRGFLLLIVLLLLGALGLQLAVQRRDGLAARVPALRPALESVCKRLGCEVSAHRHIESIVIDSSSFNKTRGETYELSLTLKNTAATALATPAIELTITDTQDQPILRRVLQPSDMGIKAVLPAHGEFVVALPVALAGEAAHARVAGYRLLAFYP